MCILVGGCLQDFDKFRPVGSGGSASSSTGETTTVSTTTTTVSTTGETTVSSTASVGGMGGMGGAMTTSMSSSDVSSSASTVASSSSADVSSSSSASVSSSASSSTGGPTMMTVNCGGTNTDFPEDHLVVCWYFSVSKHAATTVMKLGGSINGGAASNPFPGCVAMLGTDEYVLCDLGMQATGTDALFHPFTDDSFPGVYDVCDVSNLPSPKCYDQFWVWHDGVLKGHFDFAIGPSAPFGYVDVSGLQTLSYTE
ncbi:MAG: hypothetical protein ABIP96_05665 [Patescibacteria group bacterium]